MRKRVEKDGLSAHAIAGSRVVLLGIDVDEELTEGLLGFSLYRTPGIHQAKEESLSNGKAFAAGKTAGVHSSDKAPVQAFLWGDYTPEAGKSYAYRVVAQYGKPGALKAGAEVTVKVTTESQDQGKYGVYFNRGVAGSQAYTRRFGKFGRHYLFEHQGKLKTRRLVKPDKVADGEAYRWLSRGLEEAMGAFIDQAKGPGYALRASVYEFTHVPIVQKFVDALERGVDVQIVHHAKQTGTLEVKTEKPEAPGDTVVTTTVEWASGDPAPKTHKNKYVVKVSEDDDVCRAAKSALAQAGLQDPQFADELAAMMIPRRQTTISHNKFIVLLKDNKPVEVWTGSTNLTAGGLFGQYNVGFVVRDPMVAKKYLDYWKKLAADAPKAEMTAWTAKATPDLTKLPAKSTPALIFSPRPKSAATMLDWYAERIGEAKQAVFWTSAFTVDESFLAEFDKTREVEDGEAFQRYILLETREGSLMRDKYKRMAKVKQNCIAWGDVYRAPPGSSEGEVEEAAQSAHLIESLTGLNTHVEYLHTKYLLIDPLEDDPLVVCGSANFSDASTLSNDENMLVIRGDTGVADTFVGEFMRLYNHFAGRNRANKLAAAHQEDASATLAPDDSWTTPYFKRGTAEQQQRLLFR